MQLLINGKSYRLSDVGAGIAQFVMVLANAAVARPAYVLIDEPELSLHPSLQVDFLTTLGSYASEGVLFATHAYGLARAVADTTYSVQSTGNGDSVIRLLEDTPRMAEFLGELSYSGYQELGFKKVLLVEGRTEIKTFHQFLRWHRKDHEVVVLSLGGKQFFGAGRELELNEVKRICSDVKAIIDSERTIAGGAIDSDRQAFVDTCESIGIPCHVLERRATENYFTDEAVKRVMGKRYRTLGPFENPKGASHNWKNTENWRMAREMSREDLKETDLGEFLDDL